jgi:hypothetical protein
VVAKKPCEDCGGSRHVKGADGKYRLCDCLRLARSIRQRRAAGVPVRHDAETWKTFRERYVLPNVLAFAARAIGSPHNPGGELLLTGDDEGRELAASLLARTALDRGLLARFVDLPALIDRAFAREEAVGPDPHRVDLAVLRLGGEPRHAYNRSALERFLRLRYDSSLLTVVVGDDPARAARELGAYEAAEALEGVGDRFAIANIVRRNP